MFELLALMMQECLFFLGYITGKSQFPKPLTRQEEAEAGVRRGGLGLGSFLSTIGGETPRSRRKDPDGVFLPGAALPRPA